MELKRGSIACSAAGRDKGEWLVVLEISGGYALLCNGKDRPLERPKRKNLRHIRQTSAALTEEMMATNCSVRKALAKYAEPKQNS